METTIEILKYFASIIGTLSPILFFLWKEARAKKLSDELTKKELIAKVEEVNESQEKKINELAEKVNYLVDTHKYRPAISKLVRKLEEIIDNQTEQHNKEINRIFHNAIEKIQDVYYYWAETDFSDVNTKKVVSIIERKASSIRENINFEILQIERKNEFLLCLKQKIKPEIVSYAIQVENFAKEKTNGERITALELASCNMLNNLIINFFEVYQNFK